MADKYNRSRTQFRHARIAAGLCRDCGQAPFTTGKVVCETCFVKRQFATRRRYDRKTENDICVRCSNSADKTYCSSCMDEQIERMRERRGRNRQAVIEAYGNKCIDCGESDIRCLTLDHINNDGAKDRRSNGRQINSVEWYARLYKQLEYGEIRKDLVVRCFNDHARKDLNPSWLQ